MMDQSKTKSDKKELFKKAIQKQTKITKENIFGEGLDIPMLGISRAAKEIWPNENLALFQDPTFQYSLLFKLSTSQVPINLPGSYMGYGAVVPDGYGVSYNLQDNQIIFAICSFFSCESTNSRKFADALASSLQEMKDLFIEEWDSLSDENYKNDQVYLANEKYESNTVYLSDEKYIKSRQSIH